VKLFNQITLIVFIFLLSACATKPKTDVAVADKTVDVGAVAGPAFLEESLPSKLKQGLKQAKQLAKQNDPQAASALLEKLKVEFPTYPHSDLNLALIALDAKEYVLAQSLVENSLRVRDNYPPSLNLLGVLARFDGKFEAAKTYYERAISAEPNYATAYLNLGVLADLYLQDYRLAKRSFSKYLEYDADNDKVSNWLVELKRRVPDAPSTPATTTPANNGGNDD
jgi:tetratricopeptide (TPR) repeat protein